MKNSILSIGYAVSLMMSAATHSAGNSPFQAEAEEQARQSLAAAKQMIRAELEQSMRMPAESKEAALRAAITGTLAVREPVRGSAAPRK